MTLKRVPDEAGEIVGSLEALYPVVAASVPAAPADSTEPEVEAEAGMGAGPDAGKPEAVTPSAPVDNLPQLPDEIDEQLLPIFLEERNRPQSEHRHADARVAQRSRQCGTGAYAGPPPAYAQR